MPLGIVSILHATIVGNTAPTVGGLSFLAASVSNTVIASNPGGDCDGPITGAGPRNWDSDGSCGLSVVGSGDPELGPLRGNGGPTRTLAPRSGSPLIDTGLQADCFAFDQRGLDRDLGGDCDIGAYERFAVDACEPPMVPIPDDPTAELVRTLLLAAPGGMPREVLDVETSMWIDHDWVGDVAVLLGHDGVTVPVVDRPGVPASTFGCDEDNILASFDDNAPDAAEDACDAGAFALAGRLRPNGRLGTFRLQPGDGDWKLTVKDPVPDFTGTLVTWCVDVELFDAAPDAWLFADGFESGDVSGWNVSLP